jgi:hypothetical protein
VIRGFRDRETEKLFRREGDRPRIRDPNLRTLPPMMKSCRTSWRAAVVLVAAGLAPAASGSQEAQPNVPSAALEANGQPARLLSAFFGLDNGLGVGVNRICPGASGQDGMPIVLSHTIDPETLQPQDFRVFTRSGAESTPLCVTLRPAGDAGELRTVLLIGELGDAVNDPPVKVLVVDDLLSDGRTGVSVNFRGAETQVIPLDAGPTLVLMEVVPEDEGSTPGRGSACPAGTRQVLRATWSGGVRRPNGDEAGDAERALYRVTLERADGSVEEVAPAALADLGDRDNNHLLCLDKADSPVTVAFPAGYLVDPNQDLNPDTHVAVTRDSGGR